MQKQPTTPWIPDENPSLNGPDYVALVIEWDQIADHLEAGAVEDEIPTEVTQRIEHVPYALLQLAGVAVGAIAVIGLAAYGIHRLRAA